jgi:hypothetical protein
MSGDTTFDGLFPRLAAPLKLSRKTQRISEFVPTVMAR